MMPPHQSAVFTLTQEVLTDPDLAMMTHPLSASGRSAGPERRWHHRHDLPSLNRGISSRKVW